MVRVCRLSADWRFPIVESHRRRPAAPPAAHRARPRAGVRSSCRVSPAAHGRKIEWRPLGWSEAGNQAPVRPVDKSLAKRPRDRSKRWSGPMDSEHRALVISTLELIEATRGEILQLRKEIDLARIVIDQSHKLLSRTQSLSLRR